MNTIKEVKGKILLIFAAVFLIIIAGCTENQQIACTADAMQCPDGSWVGRSGPDCEFVCPNNNIGESIGSSMKKFESDEEMTQFLRTRLTQNMDSFETMDMMAGNLVMESSSMVRTASDSIQSAPMPSSGADYSQTNIQVEGVDEGDIIKNDGEYIYGIGKNKFYIMKAYPPSESKIMFEKDILGRSHNLLLNNDRLAIVSTINSKTYEIPKYSIEPRPVYRPQTLIEVFDVKDREKPKLIQNYTVSGSYSQSRMIGENVYIISNEYAYSWIGIPRPFATVGNTRIMPDIYYFDFDDFSYNFNTIASININEEQPQINVQSFMLGHSDTIYVSQNNIYIANRQNNYIFYREDIQRKKFYEAILPELPRDVRNKINQLGNDAEWKDISKVIEEMYNSMSEREKRELLEKIEKSIIEFETKIHEENSKTIIHKISINNGEIEYKSQGEVKGYLLNQFSMDEYKDNLRVATTFSVWTRNGRIEYSNVYTLDSNMNLLGKIEKIAPDERIFSTRFMGDRLYMVTFRDVDPFFVIDLKDPQNPEILGELKIPGFSNYLHPYDENHIIGIGKDTQERQGGGFIMKGLKISMFDVTDFSNPIESDVFYIGGQGSYSLVENDHKAMLFDKERNLMVIPVYEVEDNYEYDRFGYYRNKVWQGAYVLDVDKNGFELRGKITHWEDKNSNRWQSDYDIKRSLYIDDYLYTISDKMIKINDMNSVDKITHIQLPYKEHTYYRSPYYYDDIEVVSQDMDMGVSDSIEIKQ